MISSWFQGTVSNVAPNVPDSPWLTATIWPQNATALATPTTYLQRDGWLTAPITVGSFTRLPVPTSYMYAPTNDWLATDRITPSAITSRPTPTEYLKAN